MKVSVCMITYNHEQYIAQAIESVLMQETDFDYELVIGEDCSTDGTRAIISDYKQRYPNKIQILLPEQNLGITRNFLETLSNCRGQYIARLEGDDYWTDKGKLQKQIDFLEKNSTIMGCFHDAVNVDQYGNVIKEQYYKPAQVYYNQEEALKILKSCYATCSLVFNASVLKTLPQWFIEKPRDFTLDLLITEHGLLYYLPENMAAYRIHFGGVWQGKTSCANLEEDISRYRISLKDKKMERLYKDYLNNIISSVIYRLVCFHREELAHKKVKYMYLFLKHSKWSLSLYKVLFADMLFPEFYASCKNVFSKRTANL